MTSGTKKGLKILYVDEIARVMFDFVIDKALGLNSFHMFFCL